MKAIDLDEILNAQKIELPVERAADFSDRTILRSKIKSAMLEACKQCLRELDAELFELFCKDKIDTLSPNRMLTEYERTQVGQAIQKQIFNVEKLIKV